MAIHQAQQWGLRVTAAGGLGSHVVGDLGVEAIETGQDSIVTGEDGVVLTGLAGHGGEPISHLSQTGGDVFEVGCFPGVDAADAFGVG